MNNSPYLDQPIRSLREAQLDREAERLRVALVATAAGIEKIAASRALGNEQQSLRDALNELAERVRGHAGLSPAVVVQAHPTLAEAIAASGCSDPEEWR